MNLTGREAILKAIRELLALVVALGLSGCGGVEGYLAPDPSAADAPGTSHVEMVVVTTRTRAQSAALLFGGGRAPEVS